MAQLKGRIWPVVSKRTRTGAGSQQQHEYSELYAGLEEAISEAEKIHGIQPPAPQKGQDPTPVPSRVLQRIARLTRELSEAISPYL